ncbi:unnamed protein product [Cuscuta epithymum]|uniref:Uncharacterized protein n=1 Tax=Cuscuta epithymum TaxID=186058 RepID=A0AAV0CVG7_9ASTE|nr:unnamed protein product [Cuscuta epithymum]
MCDMMKSHELSITQGHIITGFTGLTSGGSSQSPLEILIYQLSGRADPFIPNAKTEKSQINGKRPDATGGQEQKLPHNVRAGDGGVCWNELSSLYIARLYT